MQSLKTYIYCLSSIVLLTTILLLCGCTRNAWFVDPLPFSVETADSKTVYFHNSEERLAVSLPTGPAAEITWFSGKKDDLSLEPIGESVGYAVSFEGWTSYKYVIFSALKEEDGSGDRFGVRRVSPEGRFRCLYMLKEGPGRYKLRFFGSDTGLSGSFEPLGYCHVDSTSELGIGLNEISLQEPILEYLDDNLGKTIGRGECWDLIDRMLNSMSADRQTGIINGMLLDIENDEILSGDILYFNSVNIATCPDLSMWETIGNPHHFAVVYRVNSKKNYMVFHQNVEGQREVISSNVNLNRMLSGCVKAYRPVAGLISY